MILPKRSDTLLTSWQGPFHVVNKCFPVNYLVDVRGNNKLFHVNMLKRYSVHEEDPAAESLMSTLQDVAMATAATVIDDVDETDDGFQEGVPLPVFEKHETWRDVLADKELPCADRLKILKLLASFSNILTDVPGETDEITHVITLSDYTPIKVHQYSLPLHYEEAIKTELRQMLNMGIV